MATYDQIDDAETHITSAKEALLRRRSWAHTCNVPGSLWMWTKVFPEYGMVMGNTEQAYKMQRHYDDLHDVVEP